MTPQQSLQTPILTSHQSQYIAWLLTRLLIKVLPLKLVLVEALGSQGQHLVVAASTAEGAVLAEDDPEKLLPLAAQQLPAPPGRGARGEGRPPELQADVEARKNTLLREINQRNLGYFEQEVEKLDA